MMLHRKRWGTVEGESEAFHSESVIAFHRELVTRAADQGWLRLRLFLLETEKIIEHPPVAAPDLLKIQDHVSARCCADGAAQSKIESPARNQKLRRGASHWNVLAEMDSAVTHRELDQFAFQLV